LLQNNGTKFEWIAKCEQRFQHLNKLLTNAPILKVADLDEYFVNMCIDVCKEGLGGVLMQNGHVICYESRNMKENERNYATHDLELVELVLPMKEIISWEES
jgi:hypothetical protein